MARIIPYAAIQFTSHEQFKKVSKINVHLKRDVRYSRIGFVRFYEWIKMKTQMVDDFWLDR